MIVMRLPNHVRLMQAARMLQPWWLGEKLVFGTVHGYHYTRNSILGMLIHSTDGSTEKVFCPDHACEVKCFIRDGKWHLRTSRYLSSGGSPYIRYYEIKAGPDGRPSVDYLGGASPDSPSMNWTLGYVADSGHAGAGAYVDLVTPAYEYARHLVTNNNPLFQTLVNRSLLTGIYDMTVEQANSGGAVVVNARTGEITVMIPPGDGAVRHCGVRPDGAVGWMTTSKNLYFFDI